MNAPNCPDCHVTMEEGFVPEFGHYNQYSVSGWYPGEPQWVKILFSRALSIIHARQLPIQTYRCPTCGLLREYAPQKPQA